MVGHGKSGGVGGRVGQEMFEVVGGGVGVDFVDVVDGVVSSRGVVGVALVGLSRGGAGLAVGLGEVGECGEGGVVELHGVVCCCGCKWQWMFGSVEFWGMVMNVVLWSGGGFVGVWNFGGWL